MKKVFLLGAMVCALGMLAACGGKKEKNDDMTQIKYKTVQVEDCTVFYREVGDPQKPTLLLLHGFPSSSAMFRELMADKNSKHVWPQEEQQKFHVMDKVDTRRRH